MKNIFQYKITINLNYLIKYLTINITIQQIL